MEVIAMAYRGRPLERIATGATEKVMYLLNPSANDAKNPSAFSGVGFPLWAVFDHDSDLLASLTAAWNAEDRDELDRLWEMARPAHASGLPATKG